MFKSFGENVHACTASILYLVFKFSANKLYLILGIVSFGVHSFWFKNWFTKYFLQSKDKIKVTKKKKSE